MIRFILIFTCLFLGYTNYAQEKQTGTEATYKVTESVKKHRAKGYPLRVLESLPMVKGCESLANDDANLAKCMKDQLNFIFASTMNGVEEVAEDRRGVSIYIEFIIDKEGKISAPERVKVSEQILDQFARKRFEKFREKVNQDNLITSPGKVHAKVVNTLYGVKFIKPFKN